MRITFVIAMLICSCCIKAQNTTRGKVATHMALVRTYLSTGDTISALKEYQIISEITPNDENIKKRIAELSEKVNITEDNTHETKEEPVLVSADEEPTPKPEENMTVAEKKEQVALEDIAEEKANVQDFSKFGGFGNYKKKQAVNNATKKTESNKPKQSVTPKSAYKQQEDVLAKAFAGVSQNDNNLFRFTNLPSSPLHSLLIAEKNDEASDLQGRWISSLRSNDVYAGTMFMFGIAPNSNKLDLIDDQSRIKNICENNGYTLKYGKNELAQGKIASDFSVSYEASNYNNVKTFVDKLLKPFFNNYVINNPETLELMTKGVLKHDTIINETVRYDTITTQNKKEEIQEVVEVVFRDTTVNSYYKLDSLFKIRCNISFNVSFTRNILHGNCILETFIEREEGNIPVVKATIPCSFYRVEDDYNDNYVFAVAEETHSTGTKQKNEYDVDINNIGMEKAFEKLASGREKKSVDALNVSADLIVSAPCGDFEQAYKWFNEAANKKNTYAMMRLAQMKLKGEGCEKDAESAISLLEESLANDYFDAGYELALAYIGQNSLSKAYSKAIESASNDSFKAMGLVAEMFFTGIAVRPNTGKALSWLKKMQKTISQENN